MLGPWFLVKTNNVTAYLISFRLILISDPSSTILYIMRMSAYAHHVPICMTAVFSFLRPFFARFHFAPPAVQPPPTYCPDNPGFDS